MYPSPKTLPASSDAVDVELDGLTGQISEPDPAHADGVRGHPIALDDPDAVWPIDAINEHGVRRDRAVAAAPAHLDEVAGQSGGEDRRRIHAIGRRADLDHELAPRPGRAVGIERGVVAARSGRREPDQTTRGVGHHPRLQPKLAVETDVASRVDEGRGDDCIWALILSQPAPPGPAVAQLRARAPLVRRLDGETARVVGAELLLLVATIGLFGVGSFEAGRDAGQEERDHRQDGHLEPEHTHSQLLFIPTLLGLPVSPA